MNYRAYLQSDHWIELRGAKLEDAGFRCEQCRRRSCLEVHHLHYNSFGRERLNDLKVLCRWCHQKHHDKEIPSTTVAPAKRCMKEIQRDFKMAKYAEIKRLESEFFAAAKLGLERKAEKIYQRLKIAKSSRLPK